MEEKELQERSKENIYPNIWVKKVSVEGRRKNTTRYEVMFPVVFWYYGQKLTIPAGFKTDFASVPSWLWWFIPPHGLACNPSVIHDYLYRYKILKGVKTSFRARKLADIWFISKLFEANVSVFQSLIMFWGVRIGGEKHWKKEEIDE